MSTMAIFKGRVTVAKGLASMTGGQGRNKAHRNIGNGGASPTNRGEKCEADIRETGEA